MQQGWADPRDAQVVAHARVLPLDIVQAKGNGHAGTAVSLTPALYVLFQEYLRQDPADDRWVGRDRFVLSAGHTSLSLYLQLYLSGYPLEMDDLKAARVFGSLTPGHPEFGHTRGVETSTGPLGQGIANAVGMAMARQRMRTMLDPDAAPGESPFDHTIWCLAGDGCVQEGISHEAGALAGHLELDGLVLIWDDNEVSIEGGTAVATSENVPARWAAYGWHVVAIDDAEDPDAIRAGLAAAATHRGGPVFLRLRTRIGHPMPSVGGTGAAHSGPPGAEEIVRTKEILGLDPEQSFAMPAELLEHARAVRERGAAAHAEWDARFARWGQANPDAAALLTRLESGALPDGWLDALPVFEAGDAPATRVANSTVLAALTRLLPELWGGSADLAETNGTMIDGMESYLPPGASSKEWPGAPGGRMLHFGIREHAMGGILNGIALASPTRPYGATFLCFADYMRPSVRLAALMRLPVTYIWTHDSVALGEDGPTHQPVEHLWALRGIPGMTVVRPADGNETAGAWIRMLTRPDGPVGLALSRQALPTLDVDRQAVLDGTARGAYVVAGDDDGSLPDLVLIATGSEVSLALQAREELGAAGVRATVVSAPCLEWFDQEPEEYRDAVLPPAVLARVSVEAGNAVGWHRYIGTFGEVVSVEDFGLSGSGAEVLAHAGVTVDAILAAARRSLERADALSAWGGRR
jgi:transketolase